MRKSVLILGHSYPTQFIDVLNQYTRLFDAKTYKVTVAYLTGESNEVVRKRTIAEEVIFLNQSKKSIRGLKFAAIYKLLKLCQENKFQIVICHRYKPIYIMMWVAQFYKIPALIYVLHELKTMSSIGRQLLIAILKRKNMVFAGVSNAVRDDLRKSLWFLPPKQIVTLYNVIDIELTEPQLISREQARSTLNLPEHAFVFGNIARLVPNKDQRSLISAFDVIKDTCPTAILIIMGEGHLENELKQFVQEKQLESRIIFTGFVANAFRYMKGLDCFVLSSTQEAFGRVLLEAMIARCPVIATRANGIPEVIANAGLLVQPKDITGLANAMKHIYQLSQEKQREQGNQGYQHTSSHYSIPVFQRDFWQLPLLQSIQETTL